MGTGAPEDNAGICQEPRDPADRERVGGRGWADTPIPAHGHRTHNACSQGVIKVAEDTRLLTGRALREAGVVHITEETLEPGYGAR